MNRLNRGHRLDPEAQRGRSIRMATALIVVVWSVIALWWLPAS